MLADKALPLWPNDPNLLGLKASAFQAQGQLDEAQPILSHVTLNTTNLDLGSGALIYQTVLRHDRASAGRFLDSHPHALESNDPWFLLHWATVQEAAGRQEDARTSFTRVREAVEALLKAQPQGGDLVGKLAMALAGLDQRENALKALEQFTALRAGDARQAALQHELCARIFARLGEKDRAIASLEQVLSAPSDGIFGPPITPAILRLDPMFDPLRGDPRFEKLCQEQTK